MRPGLIGFQNCSNCVRTVCVEAHFVISLRVCNFVPIVLTHYSDRQAAEQQGWADAVFRDDNLRVVP